MPNTYPTIFLGVGGLGNNIVRRLWKKFQKMHAYRPDDFDINRFFFMVTDPVSDIPATKTAGDDGFPRDQFYVLNGFDDAQYKRYLHGDEFKDFKPRVDPNYSVVPSALDGYNGVRYNGAFGLKLSCEHSKVGSGGDLSKALQEAVRNCTTFKKNMPTISGDTNPRFYVYLLGSMCGGTGSGVLLDLGYVVRAAIQKGGWDPMVIGVFGLPELMQDFLTADLLWANAYAFLRELNWLMVEPDKKAAQTGMRRFFYKQRFGHAVQVDEAKLSRPCPYDMTWFLSQTREDGEASQSTNEVLQMTSETLFLLTAGSSASQFIPNTKAYFPGTPYYVRNMQVRSLLFGGFGSYSLRFPADLVRDYLVALAAPALLGNYVISPLSAPKKGLERYEALMANEEVALSLDRVKSKLLTKQIPSSLNYTDDINAVDKPKKPSEEDEAEGIIGVQTLLARVKKETLKEAKEIHRPNLQKECLALSKIVVEGINREVDRIFATKQNFIAIGEAAVFLKAIKDYCAQQTGVGLQQEETDSLEAQAGRLRVQMEKELQPPYTKLVEVAFGSSGPSLFGEMKKFRQRLQAAVGDMIERAYQAELMDALQEFYLRLLNHVDALKRPLRFIQEDVAQPLQSRFVRQAPEKLSTGGAAAGEGLTNYVLCDRKQVDAIIKPAIPILSENSATKNTAEERFLIEFVPKLHGLVNEVRKTLEGYMGNTEDLLKSHKTRFEQELRKILDETLGSQIYQKLEEEFPIGRILLEEAKSRGVSGTKAVKEVEGQLATVFKSPQVYSNMDPKACTDVDPFIFRFGRMNIERFNEVIAGETGSAGYDILSQLKKLNAVNSASQIPDPFVVDGMLFVVGRPLFALRSLAQCRSTYDHFLAKAKETRGAGGNPLHTDYRYLHGDINYRLPFVEIEEVDTGDIFLFLLAEQDWWRGLKGFIGKGKWDGDLKPPITSSRDGKYTFDTPDGKKTVKGRESAQMEFGLAEKIRESLRNLLGPRWNEGKTETDRREMLVELRDRKQEAVNKTKYAELKRCYQKEIDMIKDRLERGHLTI